MPDPGFFNIGANVWVPLLKGFVFITVDSFVSFSIISLSSDNLVSGSDFKTLHRFFKLNPE